MVNLRSLLLNIIDTSKLPKLPEGIILADSILFVLIVLLLVYTYFRSNKRKRNDFQDVYSERQVQPAERDVLMQPKSNKSLSENQTPLSNFSPRNALLWLLGLFVIINIIIMLILK